MPLGFTPGYETIVLSKGSDWVCNLTDQGGSWPEGTTCWVEIDGLEDPITATVTASTATASFLAQSDIVDTVRSGAGFDLYLRYPTTPDSTEYTWFCGHVSRAEGRK